MRFPATPGWGPLGAVVAVSAGFGGGFPVLRVFVARRVLVCVLCVCGGGVGVGVSPVSVGACVACGGLFPWLGLVEGDPSPLLAEVPACVFPPLLAGFPCRGWWVFLATPG